jgi:N-methylhydantoinase A
VYVTASCDLLPRFREYERLSTTVVNAYLGPLMNHYLDALGRVVSDSSVRAHPHIMQSNGGLIPLETARYMPASTVLSGPAAGAAAAAFVCAQLGIERAIALDMGGTSTDVSLIEGGLPASASGREVGGYAVELPGVDVRCIGAGGGSVLSVDPGGLPQVGPRSAGAEPGPACYGRGGEAPTLTDAFATLGRLSPEGLLGGEMALDSAAARSAVERGFGEALGLVAEQAALGAVELSVANVRRAVEGITVAEGRDPREFCLIAAGGAGPLIACEVAAELAIEEVIVPPWPGNFSACGLLASDLRRDWVETRLILASPECLPVLAAGFRELEQTAREWAADTQLEGTPWLLLRQVSARYAGQDYELQVQLPSGGFGEEELSELVAAFHRVHEEHYGYALPERPVEFVDLSVSAVCRAVEPVGWQQAEVARGHAAPRDSRPIFLDGTAGARECAVYARIGLHAGDVLHGPAAVDQYDATTYLPMGWRARVDQKGNLRIRRELRQ